MTRILVVDDSPLEQRLAGSLLRKAGCDVIFADDGKQALEKLELAPVDIVLTDMVMPEMDGLELLDAVRTRYPRLPVVVFTSQGTEETAVQALHAGASGYVPKRHAAKILVKTIESLAEVSRQERRTSVVKQRLQELAASFELNNDRGELCGTVKFLQQLATDFGLCADGEWTRIGVALDEALINAMVHGNLEISSDCRENDDGTYERLIAERSRQAPYANRKVVVSVRFTRSEARFTIRDEGPGFQPSDVPDPTDPENLARPSGRGLLLIRAFMDEVRHNATGNEITMTKYARRAEPSANDEDAGDSEAAAADHESPAEDTPSPGSNPSHFDESECCTLAGT